MPKPIALKAGIVAYRPTDSGQVELVLITARFNPDSWIFPVGTVDPGESLRETAARECYEESGYTVAVESYLGVIELDKGQSVHRLTFFTAIVTGEVAEWETDRQRRWVLLEEVPALVASPFRPIAQAALDLLGATKKHPTRVLS